MNERKIDEEHRLELLRFLLVKTAAVRRGVKPAELLRVRHCYATANEDGLRVCLYRSDIYEILGLDYVELKVEEQSSLVLFYNRTVLSATLGESRNARWLGRMGYPAEKVAAQGSCCVDLEGMLSHLVRRASECILPHEVGIFIGYPLKDVVGFMQSIPATPVHNGMWRVYGGAEESLRRMYAYAREERVAERAIEKARDVKDFIRMISYNKAG